MSVAAFDTFKYAKTLEEAGFTDVQVDAQVAALTEALHTGIQELATKGEIREVKGDIRELKAEISQLRQEIKSDMQQVLLETKNDDAPLHDEFKQMGSRILGDLLILRWMSAFAIVLHAGMAWLLFTR